MSIALLQRELVHLLQVDDVGLRTHLFQQTVAPGFTVVCVGVPVCVHVVEILFNRARFVRLVGEIQGVGRAGGDARRKEIPLLHRTVVQGTPLPLATL